MGGGGGGGVGPKLRHGPCSTGKEVKGEASKAIRSGERGGGLRALRTESVSVSEKMGGRK